MSNANGIQAMVRAALAEDAATADVTVDLLAIDTEPAVASLVLGADAVVCGVDVAAEVFHQVDPSVRFVASTADGDRRDRGEVVLRVEGAARSILSAERVAVNFVSHLSGVATLTADFVERVRGTGVTILDTRKTTPLWRDLEKYAVRCGGGRNHRIDLSAMVLIKDNHIRALGGVAQLGERLGRATGDQLVEVEVDSLKMLAEVLPMSVDRVMLDNFTPDDVRAGVERVREFKRTHPERRLEVEVSGGVSLDNVADYAVDGVDFISVGLLTHSAPAVPLSLEFE